MRNILPNVRVNLAWRELVSPPCQLPTLKNQIPYCTEDKFSNSDFKHAVGNFLTVLKLYLYLQIFRKHAKITYWKTVLQPVVLFWKCAFCVGMSFLFFWSVWFRPLTVYPVIFQRPGLPVCRKHCILQLWKWANKLGQWSQILPDLKSLGLHLTSFMTTGIFKCR